MVTLHVSGIVSLRYVDLVSNLNPKAKVFVCVINSRYLHRGSKNDICKGFTKNTRNLLQVSVSSSWEMGNVLPLQPLLSLPHYPL